jgi:hypothetical protein
VVETINTFYSGWDLGMSNNEFKADVVRVANLKRAISESVDGDLVFRDAFLPQGIKLKDLSGSFSGSQVVTNASNIAILQGETSTLFVDVATLQSRATDVESEVDDLQEILENTGEPTGFVNRTDSVLKFDKTTRQVTISGAFDVYYFGEKFSRTFDQVTLPDVTDNYFVYYVKNGNDLDFVYSNSFWDLETHVPGAYVYWDADISDGFGVEERHGISMDWATHQRLHLIDGTKTEQDTYVLENYKLNEDSDLTSVQPTVTTGVIHDEDIRLRLSPDIEGNYSIVYREGSKWTFSRNNTVPYFYDSTIKYNKEEVGNFSLEECISGGYVNYFGVGSTALEEEMQFFFVPGQLQHASQENALLESFDDLEKIGFPFQEFSVLYQILLHSNGGSNPGGAEIVGLYRLGGDNNVSTGGGGGGITEHNFLGGRTDSNAHPAVAISVDNTSLVSAVNGATTVQEAIALIDANLVSLQSQITSNDAQLSGLIAISGDHEQRIQDLEDITDLDDKYVDVTGDTMTGALSTPELTVVSLSGSQEEALKVDATGKIQKTGYAPLVGGQISLNVNEAVYSIINPNITTTSNPVCTIVPPVSGSAIYGHSVYGVTNGSFIVELSDTPAISGYYLNWMSLQYI